jgi:hypothetical protein
MTLIDVTRNVEPRPPDRCPWCGHPISRSKFVEIEGKIREQEQKRSLEVEARLKQHFEHQLKTEREAAEKRATEVAAKQLAAISAERNEAVKKVQEATAREASFRKEVEEQAKQNAKRILEETEHKHRENLDKQRSSLEKAQNAALLKQQAEYNRLREAGQKKVKELEQQLQRKTAHELGEGAEVDVFDALRDAFQGDLISRIPKVDGGADIMHQVSYKGEVCGRIVYDSKNRQTWHWAYINKLREDQIKAHAEHAFLPSSVFPSGKKELFVHTGVVVVNPARLVDVVSLVRAAMIRMHALGLSMKERATKMTEVYKYITSEVHMKRLREMAQLNDDILELDVKEKKAHDNTWKARGSLLIRLKNVLREDETEINAILERGSDDRPT